MTPQLQGIVVAISSYWIRQSFKILETYSAAVVGDCVVRQNRTFPKRSLSVTIILVSGNSGIIVIPFAVYVIEMELHGSLQITHNFTFTVKSSNLKKKMLYYPATSVALLANFSIPVFLHYPAWCLRRGVPTSLLDLRFQASYVINGWGECNIEVRQNSGLSCTNQLAG